MDQLMAFLSMDGYGAFVWPAYLVSAAILLILLLVSLRTMRAQEARLAEIRKVRRGPAEEEL